MTDIPAFGWRPVSKGTSSGLDFLGLAAPIEGLLDAETSGITNATRRVRYFSLVPWYYWRYASQGGAGSAKDQRQFAIGFEMLIAYANIAWVQSKGAKFSGIIRRRFCEKEWFKGSKRLPLRGDAVGDTPSPLDAALYGPSLRRLNLLGRDGSRHTCRHAGIVIAKEVDSSLGIMPGCDALMKATIVDRAKVAAWASALHLASPGKRERQLLRALLFAQGPFAQADLPPRVYSLLLLLGLARTGREPFTSNDVEAAYAAGLDLSGRDFSPEEPLREAYARWRVIALLKFFRHASELAFAAVHHHVGANPGRFVTAQGAAEDLLALATSEQVDGDQLPVAYANLLTESASARTPTWYPAIWSATSLLRHAVRMCAWCHAILRSESGRALLADQVATVGSALDAHLLGYSEQLDPLAGRPTTTIARWLCVDRALARHFRVAARKLSRHDTFRLIEDEGGLSATDKCPIPEIAIRVGAMLSLIRDLRLLGRSGGGYTCSNATEEWYKRQMQHFG